MFKKVRIITFRGIHESYLLQAQKYETVFTVYTPPHVGFYKLEIYASQVPKTSGKINLPLVALFMLEVRHGMNFSINVFQVRLQTFGTKGSQESSFQNRRGTQEMAPVHGEEKNLFR